MHDFCRILLQDYSRSKHEARRHNAYVWNQMRYLSSRIGLSLKSDTLQRLERLEKRVRISDSKRLAAYEGNLIIEMVKRLSENHDVECEITGNDPEASKKKLVGAAETLIKKFGTAKKINGRVTENESEVNNKWQRATGFLPKYMSAVKNFEKKVEARNVLVRETAGQLAQLLMEDQHFDTHNYHYIGGLIQFLLNRTVEEMAAEEDMEERI